MTKRARVKIITKAICDRKFDIPDWMYEYIDIDVVKALLPNASIRNLLENAGLPKKHPYNKSVKLYDESVKIKEFFDRVRENLDIKGIEADRIYSSKYGIFAVALFGKRGWRRVRALMKNDKLRNRFVSILANYLLSSEDLFDYADMVVSTVGLKDEYLIESVYNELQSYPESDRQERIFRLMEMLEVYNNYRLVQKCLSLGIPAFYSNGDITDLYSYLSMVIESGWKYKIDVDIVNLRISEEDVDILEKMVHIFKYLNRSIIVQAKEMITDSDIFEKYFNSNNEISTTLAGTTIDKSVSYGIKDFNDLIHVFGNNAYGIPIPTQVKFIVNGGDIRTMFTEGGALLPEASIIKASDQLDYIIKYISVDDLRFLIYNSADFVKNIISSYNFTQASYIKILKAIFEYPINESLWKVLNKKEYGDSTIDFRETIIRKVISLITLNNVFMNVPESMLYIEPGALFVTRNLSPNNIPFIPVTKLIPYLPSIISHNDYVKFNRYCDGVYVPLTQVVSMDVLVKNITKYEKYGYLGDIDGIDHETFMDTYM